MSNVVRFGVSMDQQLVEMLDELTQEYHFSNRSQTLRHMVHDHIVAVESDKSDEEVTAIISLIYRAGTTLHRVPISTYPSISISTNLQTHIKKELVLKILVVNGVAKEVRQWAFEVMKQQHVVGKISIVAIDHVLSNLPW
jgi:CopG family nickel-responsive transcriptional regulator